jgi:hypothetical protein
MWLVLSLNLTIPAATAHLAQAGITQKHSTVIKTSHAYQPDAVPTH